MRTVWLTSATLRQCAFERLDQSLAILDSGLNHAWPFAAYTAGVAVECAIRAKRKAVTNETNARHRLQELATEADYSSRLKSGSLERFNADLDRMDRLWDNLLRYCSSDAYLQFLDRRLVRIDTPYGRLKLGELAERVGEGEAMRLFAEETYMSAARLVNYGERYWSKR